MSVTLLWLNRFTDFNAYMYAYTFAYIYFDLLFEEGHRVTFTAIHAQASCGQKLLININIGLLND